MLRRNFIVSSGLTILAGCALGTPSGTPVPVNQARVYIDDLVNALSAASQVYLVGPPVPSASQQALVNMLIASLQALNKTVQSTSVATDIKTLALEILAGVAQVTPILSAFLGPAAIAIPLAEAVIQAFIQSLPAPAGAGPNPPVALHRLAVRFKHN